MHSIDTHPLTHLSHQEVVQALVAEQAAKRRTTGAGVGEAAAAPAPAPTDARGVTTISHGTHTRTKLKRPPTPPLRTVPPRTQQQQPQGLDVYTSEWGQQLAVSSSPTPLCCSCATVVHPHHQHYPTPPPAQLANTFLAAEREGRLPAAVAPKLLPWARGVVQLASLMASVHATATTMPADAPERATADLEARIAKLTALRAFVSQERLKVWGE